MSGSDLYIRQLAVGPMQNFAYLVGSRSAKRCYVVDPAWDLAAIEAAAAQDSMTIAGALVTHFHPDHCGGHLWGHDIQGVAELVGRLHVPVYAHAEEVAGLCHVTGLSRSDVRVCKSGDEIDAGGGVKIKTIHTPGHTPGSQCFLCGPNLVTGDTLFISGCGRVDLPGGSAEQLYDSLVNKLSRLPDDTVVYPGHHYDPASQATLGEVKAVNPYLTVTDKSGWMGLS